MGKIMYLDDEFQGRIVVNGGKPVPVEQKLIGTIYSFGPEARMGIIGEMPVTLSSRKKQETPIFDIEDLLKKEEK